MPLRPLSLGELLDGAVGYIRAHPRVVLGVSAVVAVITVLLRAPFLGAVGPSVQAFTQGAATGRPPTAADLGSLLGGLAGLSGVSLVVESLGTAVLTGLLVVVLARAVLGAPVDAREVWGAARPRLLGLLGLVVLVGVLIVLAFAVFLVPAGILFALGANVAAFALGALGWFAGLAAAVAVGTLLSLAAPAYVLEGITVTAALRRSRTLVAPRFWPVLGTLALTVVLVAVVGLIIGGIVGAPAQSLAGDDPAALYQGLPLVITCLGTVLSTALTAPFQAGVTGLLYIDQRMRREDFDIELQRAAHGLA